RSARPGRGGGVRAGAERQAARGPHLRRRRPAARRGRLALRLLRGPASSAALVPAMELREVAGIPCLAQPRLSEIPVRPDLLTDRPEVVPEVDNGGPAPEPIAVVDAVDDEPGLEHDRVRDHRVVLGVGVLLDVEALLDDAAG